VAVLLQKTLLHTRLELVTLLQLEQVVLAVVQGLQPTQVRLAHQGKEMLAEQIPVDQAIAEAVEAVQGLLVGMPPQHLRVILVA
jgi:hypothetical protein